MKKTMKSGPASKAATPAAVEPRRRPTINDVARLANVSKKTVSRVINQSPFVNAETRERIDAVIKDLGYAPDPVARGLASRRSYLVGLIYDNPNPQHVIDTQQGILDIIRGSGLELVVHPCNRRDREFLPGVRGFIERQKLAGVILPSSVSEDEELVALLRASDTPYVRIASVLLDSEENSIVTHDREGAQQAAEHLAGLGHKVIAHVSGPDTFRSSHERRAGFVEGLKAAGLSLDRKLDLRGAYTFESGVDAGRKLMGQAMKPTAVFCGNDEMAAGVCQAIRETGLEIGKHVSVVGFDDSPLASRMWPALTTVLLPVKATGRMASVRLLGERLTKEPLDEDRQGEVHPRLVVRASTGPVRA
jgi:LacI family transcriptional regulator